VFFNMKAYQFLYSAKRSIPFFIISTLLLQLVLLQNTYPQSDSLIIEHYTGEQGLSNSSIRSIYQDNEGYMWFSTGKGLDRYDGYNFQAYINSPGDTTSFINASGMAIYMDKKGTLWFGSMHGLEKFNRTTNSFTNYLPDNSKKGRVLANFVCYMIEDKKDIFWVITGKGVYQFNEASGNFLNVEYDRLLLSGVPYADKDGSFWLGTAQGLDKFDYEKGKFIHYWHNPENKELSFLTSSKYYIRAISEDTNGILWLGTSNGLIEFNKKLNTFTNYLPNPKEQSKYSVNRVNALCQDSSGLLWIGTMNGIFTFNTKSKKFSKQFVNKSIHNYYDYVGSENVTSLYIDHSSALWVGTTANGIFKVILKKLPYKRYFPVGVDDIIKGNKGILWVKKRSGEFVKFSTEKEQAQPVNFDNLYLKYVDKSDAMYFRGVSFDYLKKVKNDKITIYKLLKTASIGYFVPSGMWYGALNGGLYFLDFTTGKSIKVFDTEALITAICEDSSNSVWAATDNGKLYCYDTNNKSVSEFISDPKDPSSISGRKIFEIYEDKKERLWFATNSGLNKYIPTSRTFVHYNENDGLSGGTAYCILEDAHGNLWIGTDKGISKFNPETNQFRNFDALQGFSSSEYFNHLAAKMDNGEMFFARPIGLIRFYPDSIKENTYIPPIVITSCKLFDKAIPYGKEIKLSYDKNFLSFEFAALSFYNSPRNRYAYKMVGIDKDWVYSGTRRYASYPDLEPSKYIFKVKGSNNDGIWNESGTSIAIIIYPPWWETNWAYASYVMIFIILLFGIRRYELNRVELKNKIKMDEAILKEREEIDIMKSRFFANISHEFRTPLTLIEGPAEKIISKTTDESIVKDAGIIKKNSKRLLQLVNQLLDLSKLEAGKMKLEASKNNIVSFVKGVALSFESLTEEKDITLEIKSKEESVEVYFDKEKILKVLSNIFSNSLKFTPENGRITINISTNFSSDSSDFKGIKGDYVEIKIKDTGIGIPKEEIPKLFDRFYQVDSSFTKEHQGTGIGLALVKELVELHHGSISVQSEVEQWTEFTICIPLGKEHLRKEEIVEEKETDITQHGIKDLIKSDIKGNYTKINPDNDFKVSEDKTIILVVEDNYDMREYIKESLGKEYIIEEAINGEQGVRKAQNLIPDLIVSDMMMPKMDGNALTRVLKNDERTSHIPIIILTAKSGQDSKLEGLETGADDYLTKPFDIKELQIRIRNLINLRKKLQQKFGQIETDFSGKKDIPLQSEKDKPLKLRNIDEKFLIKIQKVVNEHISEEDFSIEGLGSEVGMSRSQVLRKIKALTGKSPSIYVRSIRLLKAKEMIENGDGNISEVAYLVGFSSPIYFSKCFKEEFGYPPKNFM
jgi:signal transduction histidine kinase/ligand-binding sensor domain-containing protein/CheY-like chemotaxis protein/AraC-like DNA-binding protein